MKRLMTKATLGITIILTLGLLVTGVAKAYSQCYPSSGNCRTTAYYFHYVWNAPGSSWEAGVRSFTANPTRTMDDIGYSYWSLRQWCYTTLLYATTYGGHVNHYASDYWATTIQYKYICSNPNQRLAESLGNHDFYDWPYNHIYPYSYKSAYIP